ncbi:hypothetical protein [Rhizobium ruizarguesonis]|uniref:hypothetical protein n=1 Tax=Rhizobium ruizarguesonis TaxID=2081791 RepID=UPI00103232DA|nr:hypothetical protein [Rhizobium ruizarguesonis]TAY75167.1 hypothetical protein ELH84_15490 [Rhizobium ruizarguesonis]
MPITLELTPRFSRFVIFLSSTLLLSAQAASARNLFENIGHEVGSCLSGGCDVVWDVNRRIDDGISSKTESAVAPIKKAVHEILEELFKKNIDPMLDRMNSITEERLKQIDDIVSGAIDKAQLATAATISSVKTDIIIESSNQVQIVSKAILGDLRCAEFVTKDNVQTLIDENFRIFGKLRDAAHALVDRCADGVDRNNYWTVYSGLKCAYDAKISNANTVGEMQGYYHAFLEETSKAECIMGNESNISQVRDDQRNYTKRLNLWNLALN